MKPPVDPRELQSPRFARDDLLLLQQAALRSWRDSDWLAAHDPRAYERIREQDPTQVVVDLGGGIGESRQVPGAIVLGEPQAPFVLASGERRGPDLTWEDRGCLPFENATVDVVYATGLRHLLHHLVTRLPRELARVCVVGGTVHTDATGMDGYGFTRDGTTWVLSRKRAALADVAPANIEETVLGTPVRRAP